MTHSLIFYELRCELRVNDVCIYITKYTWLIKLSKKEILPNIKIRYDAFYVLFYEQGVIALQSDSGNREQTRLSPTHCTANCYSTQLANCKVGFNKLFQLIVLSKACSERKQAAAKTCCQNTPSTKLSVKLISCVV